MGLGSRYSRSVRGSSWAAWVLGASLLGCGRVGYQSFADAAPPAMDGSADASSPSADGGPPADGRPPDPDGGTTSDGGPPPCTHAPAEGRTTATNVYQTRRAAGGRAFTVGFDGPTGYLTVHDDTAVPVRAYSPFTSDGGNASSVGMAWTGSELGVAWRSASGRRVLFQRFDAAGASLGAATVVADAVTTSLTYTAQLTWDGARFALTYTLLDESWLVLIGPTGAIDGARNLTAEGGVPPGARLQETSAGLVIATSLDNDAGAYGAETRLIDRAGVLGPPIEFHRDDASCDEVGQFTSDGSAMFWHTGCFPSPTYRAQRMSPTGAPIGAPIELAADTHQFALVPTPAGYGLFVLQPSGHVNQYELDGDFAVLAGPTRRFETVPSPHAVNSPYAAIDRGLIVLSYVVSTSATTYQTAWFWECP